MAGSARKGRAIVSSCRAPADPLSTHSVAFSHYNNIGAQLPVDALAQACGTICYALLSKVTARVPRRYRQF